MELVGSEFVAKVQHYYTAWLPARDIVDQALLSRFEVCGSCGRYCVCTTDRLISLQG